MPKMKTHKGTAKRVRVTATGKVMYRSFNPKRNKRARHKMYSNRRDSAAHPSVVEQIRKNMPYASPTPARHKQGEDAAGGTRTSTRS